MKPFESIKIIDLTHVIAGPFCTFQLAMLGAEVIKIESPHKPDMMREAGPDFALADNGMGIHFLSQNAGKKSLTLDLKQPEGREILRKLVVECDVLVENFRANVMEKMELGYSDLQPLNPRLIYCSITGFGRSGPKADHPAYDNVIQAYSGLMCASGSERSGPVKVGPPVLDYGTGAQAALAISAALFQREATGQGQFIDVAMLDAALMLMASSVTETLYHGRAPELPGNSSSLNAGYGVYQAQDTQLMIGAFTPQQLSALWSVLDEPEIAQQVQAYNYQEISQLAAAHRAKLEELIRQRPAQEWEDLLNAAGVPAARVRQLDEALSSEQIKSRNVIQQVKHPVNSRDTLSLPVAAFCYKQGSPGAESAPPLLAADSNSILQDLGLSAAEINALQEKGVVRV